MWSQVIIPILTMIIGIVCGASAMDMYKTSRWMQKIDRKIRVIEKKMKRAKKIEIDVKWRQWNDKILHHERGLPYRDQ